MRWDLVLAAHFIRADQIRRKTARQGVNVSSRVSMTFLARRWGRSAENGLRGVSEAWLDVEFPTFQRQLVQGTPLATPRMTAEASLEASERRLSQGRAMIGRRV